jgi:hypothetical protein
LYNALHAARFLAGSFPHVLQQVAVTHASKKHSPASTTNMRSVATVLLQAVFFIALLSCQVTMLLHITRAAHEVLTTLSTAWLHLLLD